MYKSSCYLILTGKCFSPTKLEQLIKIEINEKIEPGQICQFGRFKNKPSEEGFAVLRIDGKEKGDVTEMDILTSSLLNEITDKRETIKNSGVESILFHIDVAYKNQCNIEISNSLLKRLCELKMPVSLTCYEVE